MTEHICGSVEFCWECITIERNHYKAALERIANFHYEEGKTGDPLYLFEICREEAKEALKPLEPNEDPYVGSIDSWEAEGGCEDTEGC